MASKHKFENPQLTLNTDTGPVSLFKQWLFENYTIKVNTLDVDDVYLEPSELNPQHYDYAVTENDIYLHALEDGLKVTRSLISSLIASPNQTIHYNPIKDYLESRKKKFKGDSQIDLLISSLEMADTEDKARKKEIIKKWFVAMAATVLGQRPNDVALGIVSDRAGIGKTTFFNEIIPLSLRKYTQTILKRNNNQLPEYSFANKLLLTFDELAALTSTTESQFKELISATTITGRVPGTRRNALYPRIASACFTSNKTSEQGGFIRSNDPGILRRLAVIEVEAIKDYREDFDVDGLWSEVMMLYEGGYDYVWNQEDFAYLSSDNKKYIISTNAMRVVRSNLTLPTKSDEVVYMTSRDLLLALKKKKKIASSMTNVDEITLGQALSTLGFKRTIKRLKGIGPRYCYEIKKGEI